MIQLGLRFLQVGLRFLQAGLQFSKLDLHAGGRCLRNVANAHVSVVKVYMFAFESIIRKRFPSTHKTTPGDCIFSCPRA